MLVDNQTTLEDLISRLDNVAQEKIGLNIYFTGRVGPGGPQVYATALQRSGNLGAAVTAVTMLREVSPDCVFVLGLAGGLQHSTQELADVVVSSEIVYYETSKITESGINQRFRVVGRTPDWLSTLASDIKIPPLEILENKTEKYSPKLRVGAIASGEKVIHRAGLLEKQLEGWGGVLAVEMEGAGVAEAVGMAVNGPPLVVIRGIADIVGEKM